MNARKFLAALVPLLVLAAWLGSVGLGAAQQQNDTLYVGVGKTIPVPIWPGTKEGDYDVIPGTGMASVVRLDMQLVLLTGRKSGDCKFYFSYTVPLPRPGGKFENKDFKKTWNVQVSP